MQLGRENISLLKQLAEQGDSFAQNRLGWMYAHGKGVPRDYNKALDLF